MGIVYKAEDTTLERTVALKFLAQHLLNDEEAKERFLREAKAAAALSHPNICTVHEIAEVDGKTFIAMEFVKGETLEERIAAGPLTLKDALDIGRQAADGLEAAHEENIIHRDIKPANVMVDAKGRAKVMDFGLARLTEASRLTKTNTAMGTVAYMSPEHAQGIEVDTRTDIWALGCVLYEMISGQRPFQGQYDQALLYEIVHEEPAALTGLRTGVPVELEFIISECLAKDRDDRTGTAQEVSRKLRTLAEKLKSGHSTILRTSNLTGAAPATMTVAQTVAAAEALPPGVTPVRQGNYRALQALAAVATLAFLGLLAFNLTESPPEVPETPLRRFSYVPPPGLDARPLFAGLAISPNGNHLAFTTTGTDGGVWVQDLDQYEPRQLAGTEGAYLPFWSPDSEYIVFAAGDELRNISVQGGASGLVCSLPSTGFFQGTWSPDGESIVFASLVRSGTVSLFQVSSQGGSPEELITSGDIGETRGVVSRPHFVSSGSDRILVFTVDDGAVLAASGSTMYAKNLDTGQTAALGLGDRPIYSASTGHLIYQSVRDTYELWARPFSPETLEFTGSALSLRQNARQPSLSDDGTLAFLDGPDNTGPRTLVWRNRVAELLEAVGQPQPDIGSPSLSPDGRRVAVTSTESGNADIWVHDLIRSTKTRLTFEDQREVYSAWSPSGREIVYQSLGPPHRLMRRAADGTGEAVVLLEADFTLVRPEWSRDGRYLVYDGIELGAGSRNDIRYIELGTDVEAGEPVMVLGSPADEQFAKLSPDGRFLAYESDESGRYEIYVRSFPGGDGKRQVSVNGGQQARWRSDGRELYYVEGDTLMAVSVSTESAITLRQPPRPLFDAPGLASAFGGAVGGYDVSADGRRFLTVAPLEDGDEVEAAPPKIRLVQNWYEEFRDRQR